MSALRRSIVKVMRLADPTPDAELVRRAAHRDDNAIELLIARHGPMVLRVCRHLLGDDHAAEDAFQAVFLMLWRRAGSLRRPDRLAAWLFGTARRIALKAKTTRARRHRREASRTVQPVAGPLDALTARELLVALDEEIERLPQLHRLPLLLCYWQGLSQLEAARRLGWTHGSVKGRLERGRKMLGVRLTKRGLAPSVLLAASATAVSLPADLLAKTAALTASGAIVPAGVAALTAGAGMAKVGMVAGIVLAAAGLVGLAGGDTPQAKPDPPKPIMHPAVQAEPRLDREGVPLPDGALMRLGSNRMRHGGFAVAAAMSPDGKMIASAADDGGAVWDVATGKLMHRFECSVRVGADLTITPDNRELIIAVRGDWERKTPDTLSRIELSTGKLVSRTIVSGVVLAPGAVVSRSGKRFAVARFAGEKDRSVHLHDTGTGRDLLKIPFVNLAPQDLNISWDDRMIAVVDVNADDVVKLYDTSDGTLKGELKRDGVRLTCARFSPDGMSVATIAAHDNRDHSMHTVEVWDIAAQKVRLTLPLSKPDAYSTHHLSFSPNGRWIATLSHSAHVLLWDAVTGKEVRRLAVQPSILRTVFSADSRTLVGVSDGGTIQLWDVETGRLERASADPPTAVRNLRFSRDGRHLFGNSGALRAWDVNSGLDVRRFPESDSIGGYPILSPDEQMLAVLQHDCVHLVDTNTGKELRVLQCEKPIFTFVGAAAGFTPDGKKLIAADADHSILVFDIETGGVIENVARGGGVCNPVVISPDGRWLAEANRHRLNDWPDGTIVIRDLKTYRELRSLAPRFGAFVADVAFSPDGRRLVSGSSDHHRANHAVQCWDVQTGRELWSAEDAVRYVRFAFSPDGRSLAVKGSDDSIVVLEAATGIERLRITGHRGFIFSLAFAPDGRTLAASSLEAPIYIWDVIGRPEGRAERLPMSELEQAWTAFAASDAAAAFQAIRRLVGAADVSVEFLRAHLKPLVPADATQVRNWISQLDSPRFAERQKASEELQQVADRAVEQLRTTLTTTKSAEVRQAIQQALDRLDEPTPERLRIIRSVEILEHIATPAARELLAELAKGAPGARLTEEAKASLERLKAR